MNLLTEKYLKQRLAPKLILQTVTTSTTVIVPIPQGERRLLVWVTNQVTEENMKVTLKQGFHWLQKQDSAYIDWENGKYPYTEMKLTPTSGSTRILVWDLME